MAKFIISPARKFYGYIKKDALLLVKRKRYLYLSILLPIIIGGLFLLLLSPSNVSIKIGICDFDSTPSSHNAFTDLKGFTTILLPPENCLNVLTEKIRKGEFSAGLEIEKGFASNLLSLKQAKIVVYYDNTDIAFANLISWKVDSSLSPYKTSVINVLNSELKQRAAALKESVDIASELSLGYDNINSRIKEIDSNLKKLSAIETEFIVHPIWTDLRPIYSEKNVKDIGITFIFPIIALFTILMLSSISFIYDKKTNFITRVKSSTSPFLYLLAKIIFFFFLAVFQFAVVLILFYIYGASYNFNFLNLLHFVAMVGVIDALAGLIIGMISDNEGIAVLFSLIISFPLMLLSGIFYPIQTMPAFMQFFAKILPLNYQIEAAKNVMLFNQNFSSSWIYVSLALFIFIYYFMQKKN